MFHKKPLIIASISDVDVKEDNLMALSYADVIELRIDLFDSISENHIYETSLMARGLFKKPLIATIRHPSEGGNKLVQDRLSIYKLIEPLVSYMDIELADCSLIKQIKGSNQQVKIIGSYHNFHYTPNIDEFEKIIDLADTFDIDIVKIATMAQNTHDIVKLFDITERYRDRQIITIAMGKIGFFSRISSWIFGSMMTYGHIGEATAPGQATVKEMRELIDLLYSRIAN